MGNISYLRHSQSILAQVDRDECIVHLTEVMDDAYSFVKEAEPIKKIESHGRIILLMAQQTTECAYFIRDYAANKGFCMLTSALYAEVPHPFLQYQGNEPSKTVLCPTSIARSNNMRTSSKSSKRGFKMALFSRPQSPFPVFSTISNVLVSDTIHLLHSSMLICLY